MDSGRHRWKVHLCEWPKEYFICNVIEYKMKMTSNISNTNTEFLF